MGNCMGLCKQKRENNQVMNVEEGLYGGNGNGGSNGGEKEGGGGGFKVKVLLTRGELERLLVEVKKGERRLEEVLLEMGEEREREIIVAKWKSTHHEGWKPTLESIVECPEASEF
ncbi:hypothetical protein ACMD2_07426 [Ananas comosus]|uniref:Uncharacterized protein n=1 Tax=Ananas comosus TaxID=4615 RepID=A0A199W1P8_ANACO|nr:hypothetical protein ACMD2_07426 [Ananas comosus]